MPAKNPDKRYVVGDYLFMRSIKDNDKWLVYSDFRTLRTPDGRVDNYEPIGEEIATFDKGSKCRDFISNMMALRNKMKK